MVHTTSWPYANETGITEKLSCDVLVLGGGLAGCYAAIAAAAAKSCELPSYNPEEAAREQSRLYAPLFVKDGTSWKELNQAIAKAM